MKAITAIALTTLYLVVYTLLALTGNAYPVIAALYMASPLVLAFAVYSILKDNSHPYPDLENNEEWGYRDLPKAESGLF